MTEGFRYGLIQIRMDDEVLGKVIIKTPKVITVSEEEQVK